MPGRASRPGDRQGGRKIVPDHRRGLAFDGDRRPGACRPARQSAARCRPNSSHHGRDARLVGSDPASKPHRRGRSRPWQGDRRRQCRPPSMRRSVQKSAPPGRSGLSAENSSAVGASANPSGVTTNHRGSPGVETRFRRTLLPHCRSEITGSVGEASQLADGRLAPLFLTLDRVHWRILQPAVGEIPIISQIARILNNRC